MSNRPPFENRWTSGKTAWRWHQELEAIGVENVRVRLALLDAADPVAFPDPAIPPGFVQDWLNYHDRKAGRATRRWRFVAIVTAALAAVGVVLSVWPNLARWF